MLISYGLYRLTHIYTMDYGDVPQSNKEASVSVDVDFSLIF